MKFESLAVGAVVSTLIGLLSGSPALAADKWAASSMLASELDALESRIVAYGARQSDFDRLSAIIKQNPNNGHAHEVLGLCFDKLGYRDLASDQYVLARKVDPAYARAVIYQFIGFVARGDWARAAAYSSFARATAPDIAAVNFLDGMMEKHAHKYDPAMQYFQIAYLKDPNLPGLSSAIADLYMDRHDFDRARKLVSADLQRRPKSFEANLISGRLLSLTGHNRQAVKPLEIAYEAEPLQPRVGLLYAQALVSSDNSRAAVEPCLVDMAVEPRTADIQANKQVLKSILPSLPADAVSEAIASADRKLHGSPQLSRLYFALSDVYDQIGDYVDACVVRKQGLFLDRNYAHGYYRMGRSLEHLNDYENAAKFYLTACTKDPGNQDYIRALREAEQRQITFQNDLAAQLRRYIYANVFHPNGGLAKDRVKISSDSSSYPQH